MRKAALWLVAAGSIAYLGALGLHAAHSEDGGTSLRMAEATVGKVTEPAPTAWKLRVTISTKEGSPLDTMVMILPDHSPRLWPDRATCEAFMQTDEYESTLPALAQSLIEQGYKAADTAVTMQCVPQLPAK